MRNQKIFTNLLLTFSLGIVVGILFAPRSGDKTRKILAEKVEQSCGSALTSLMDRIVMFKGRLGEYMDDLKEKAEDTNQ